MDILFKLQPNTTKEIVKFSNFEEHYPDVNQQMSWKSITPHIRQATRKYILPYIGTKQYYEFVEQFNSGGQSEALSVLQDAIAYYTIYYGAAFKNVVIADMGLTQNSGTDTGTQTVNQWSYKEVKRNALIEADDSLDYLLDLMFKTPTSYPFFSADQEASTHNNTSFFKTTGELTKYINIQNSFRTFTALSHVIREVEETKIKPLICTPLFDFYKKTKKSDFQTHESALYDIILRATAKYTVAEACNTFQLLINHTGFKILSSTDSFDTSANAAKSQANQIEALRQKSLEAAQTAEADILQFLYQHKDKFPIWAESNCGQTINECPSVIGDIVGGIML